jgi:hypothetical protein
VEAVTREAPPSTGEDVLTTLGAGGVAEPWHRTQLKQKRSFALSRNVVYISFKQKRSSLFGGRYVSPRDVE